jgi:hypothetical protein
MEDIAARITSITGEGAPGLRIRIAFARLHVLKPGEQGIHQVEITPRDGGRHPGQRFMRAVALAG